MWNLITSYLIQSGECVLPGIGSFTFVNTPAALDVANKEMLPTEKNYRFTDKTGQPSEDLIQYVAYKKAIDAQEAAIQIKKVCSQVKEKLFSGDIIILNSIGILHKDPSGTVIFEPDKEVPVPEPVPAIRVVHKELKHPMIVGDRETDSSEMNGLLNSDPEVPAGSSLWKIAAVVLLLIGAGMLFFHLYNSSSSNPLGNGRKIIPAPSSQTYLSQ